MIRFYKINQRNSSGFSSSFQRHHLIPLQAASMLCVSNSLKTMKLTGFDYDDFDTNGVLLPCNEVMALKTGHPLHRGPHPRYNELVLRRYDLIIKLSSKISDTLNRQSFFDMRISLLQSALRHGLLHAGFEKMRLNKRDPVRSAQSFDDVDARIDLLRASTRWPH